MFLKSSPHKIIMEITSLSCFSSLGRMHTQQVSLEILSQLYFTQNLCQSIKYKTIAFSFHSKHQKKANSTSLDSRFIHNSLWPKILNKVSHAISIQNTFKFISEHSNPQDLNQNSTLSLKGSLGQKSLTHICIQDFALKHVRKLTRFFKITRDQTKLIYLLKKLLQLNHTHTHTHFFTQDY